MTRQELMDFFIEILNLNWAHKEKLGGLPSVVNNSLSQLAHNIISKLGQMDCPDVELDKIRTQLSEHFGGIGKELIQKSYNADLMKVPIPAIQVYNYLVTAVEIVAEHTDCEIPEALFWDFDWDDNVEEAQEPPPPPPQAKKVEKKAVKSEKNGDIAVKILELLHLIDQKLGVLIEIESKSHTDIGII